MAGTGARNQELFDLLVREYLPKVRRLMFNMVLNDDDADDLTQEVFMKVLRKLPSFRGDAKVSTWLFQVAINTARSHLRRCRRSPLLVTTEPPEQLAARCDQPDHRAEVRQIDRVMRRALLSLSERLRSAIVLTVLEGMDAASAAKVLGCTRATVYWRVNRARTLLAERLEEAGF